MTKQSSQPKDHRILIPLYGSVLFIILYIIAACLYPGGSQADKYHKGFSWVNNYWCTLLNESSINGEHNTARPVALTAMVLLGITLSVFWYIIPESFDLNKKIKRTIQVTGITAMGVEMFLFTGLHDTAINVGGFFGLVALAGTMLGLYKNKWISLFCFGLLNLLLFFLNNYIYWSGNYMTWLPIIQKVTFLSFLIWICCITMRVYWLHKKKTLGLL